MRGKVLSNKKILDKIYNYFYYKIKEKVSINKDDKVLVVSGLLF